MATSLLPSTAVNGQSILMTHSRTHQRMAAACTTSSLHNALAGVQSPAHSHPKNMTANEIRNLPVSGDIEINLGLYKFIADILRESLENGDANQDMREIYGSFLNQMLDVLEDFDAPENTIEEVTR